MTETIKLMKAHTSVRRFKEQGLPQEDLTEILTAAQMACMNWCLKKPFASQLFSFSLSEI